MHLHLKPEATVSESDKSWTTLIKIPAGLMDVQWHNGVSDPIELCWFDAAGAVDPICYGTITPGAVYKLSTYEGHHFVAKRLVWAATAGDVSTKPAHELEGVKSILTANVSELLSAGSWDTPWWGDLPAKRSLTPLRMVLHNPLNFPVEICTGPKELSRLLFSTVPASHQNCLGLVEAGGTLELPSINEGDTLLARRLVNVLKVVEDVEYYSFTEQDIPKHLTDVLVKSMKAPTTSTKSAPAASESLLGMASKRSKECTEKYPLSSDLVKVLGPLVEIAQVGEATPPTNLRCTDNFAGDDAIACSNMATTLGLMQSGEKQGAGEHGSSEDRARANLLQKFSTLAPSLVASVGNATMVATLFFGAGASYHLSVLPMGISLALTSAGAGEIVFQLLYESRADLSRAQKSESPTIAAWKTLACMAGAQLEVRHILFDPREEGDEHIRRIAGNLDQSKGDETIRGVAGNLLVFFPSSHTSSKFLASVANNLLQEQSSIAMGALLDPSGGDRYFFWGSRQSALEVHLANSYDLNGLGCGACASLLNKTLGSCILKGDGHDSRDSSDDTISTLERGILMELVHEVTMAWPIGYSLSSRCAALARVLWSRDQVRSLCEYFGCHS